MLLRLIECIFRYKWKARWLDRVRGQEPAGFFIEFTEISHKRTINYYGISNPLPGVKFISNHKFWELWLHQFKETRAKPQYST